MSKIKIILEKMGCRCHRAWPSLNTALPSVHPLAPTAPSPLDENKTQEPMNFLGKEARAAESIAGVIPGAVLGSSRRRSSQDQDNAERCSVISGR